MDQLQDDHFVVYVRLDPAHDRDPETNEEVLAECTTYAEARRLKHASPHDCVIRYVGGGGGGD
jgi:hypothetical protein